MRLQKISFTGTMKRHPSRRTKMTATPFEKWSALWQKFTQKRQQPEYEWMIEPTQQEEWIEGQGAYLWLAFFFSEIGAGIYFVSLFIDFSAGLILGYLMALGLGGWLHMRYLGNPMRGWRILTKYKTSELARGMWIIMAFAVHRVFSDSAEPFSSTALDRIQRSFQDHHWSDLYHDHYAWIRNHECDPLPAILEFHHDTPLVHHFGDLGWQPVCAAFLYPLCGRPQYFRGLVQSVLLRLSLLCRSFCMGNVPRFQYGALFHGRTPERQLFPDLLCRSRRHRVGGAFAFDIDHVGRSQPFPDLSQVGFRSRGRHAAALNDYEKWLLHPLDLNAVQIPS
jgi:hypothetical protein